MTSRNTLLALAALVALVCAEGLADAKKRVVVLDVEGARNKKLERSLADLVAEEATVIPSGDYRKAARTLKAAKLSPDHVAKVAARLEADGVLESLIIAEKGRYVLRLRLREGTTGRTIKKIALKMRSAELSGKMEDALADRLLGAIADLPRLELIEEMDGDPEEDAAEAMAEVEEEEEEAPPPKRKAKPKKAKPRRVASADDDFGSALEVSDPNDEVAEVDDEEPADDDEEMAADEDLDAGEVSMRPRRAAPGMGATLAAGLSVIKRKLAFNSRADMTNAPLGYRGAMVPAATIDGEVFPLSLAGKGGALANLGIGFGASKVVGLKTQVVVDDMTVALPTDETSYGLDVRYRHRVGGERGPWLVASLGWSRLRFSVDRTNGAVDLPNNNYRYYHPGLEVRYAVGRRVTLSADGKVFLITGTGGIEKATEYGAAKMTGGEGGAGLEVSFGQRWVARGGARVLLMAYQFQGTGTQTTDRDGDPSTVDVGGALDRYLSAELTAGYLF